MPTHKLIPTKELHFEDGYNIVRTEKELKANVADVEKAMAQAGDNPVEFPIRFVTIGKQKFTRNHATLRAALNRDWKEIYAVESPHEPGSVGDILDMIASNNRAHGVSRLAQGKLYIKLRDGEPADEETMKKAKVGEDVPMKRAPMTDKEILAAIEPIYTLEHVRQCMMMAESSPEVCELMESDAVALNVVVDAKRLAKDDDAKHLRILKAAIRVANAEGKDKATAKHFDAIKEDFKPKKTLKADDGTEPKDEPKEPSAKPKDSKGKDVPESLPAGDDTKNDAEGQESAPALVGAPILKEGTKANKTVLAALATFFTDDAALEKIDVSMTLNPDEGDRLAEAVLEIVAKFASPI